MTLVYATRQQLYDYTPADKQHKIPGEPEATRLLTAASIEVRLATRTAIYDTDTGGYPSTPGILTAFARATCAQALWWADNPGEETGQSDEYDSVKIGSVSLSKSARSGGAGSAGLPVGGSDRLAAAAATELAVAGLTAGAITTYPAGYYWGR